MSYPLTIKNPPEIKKILCIKPRGIGDALLSTIIIPNLINYFKNAKIHYLTEPYVKPIIEKVYGIEKVIDIRKNELSIITAKKLKKENYDIIFDLWCNPKTAQITYFTGAKYRVGYSYKGRKYAYNITGTSGRGEGHTAEHNLELLKASNVPVISKEIRLNIDFDNTVKAADFIEKYKIQEEKITSIIPSGGWNSKRCVPSKWAEICKILLDNYQTKIILLWGNDDVEDKNEIEKLLSGKVIYTAPETDILELAGFISKSSLVIANDSGPMHISAALGIPTIGIFGPTDPEKFRPYIHKSGYLFLKELHCIICNKLECPYNHECMTHLPLNNLTEIVDEISRLKRVS